MKRICNNPNRPTFKNYYHKGIRVCEEWDNYAEFYYWAYENGYNDTLTLERKDCNKGYSPENCCWIPKAEQAKNRDSFCHYFCWKGVRYTLTDIAKKFGINRNTFYNYLNKKHLSIEEIYELHATIKDED